MEIDDLIREGYLSRVPVDRELVLKELKEAENDLKGSMAALRLKDFKWAIIKGYYSMFHAARALLFSLGLKERRHFAVGMVLEELSKKGKIQSRYVNDFRAAMSSREDADYRYTYQPDTAIYIADIAEEFLKRIKTLLR